MINILGIFSDFTDTLWKIAGLIAIVLIVYACIKFPNGRLFVLIFLGLALTAVTIYCGIQLNYYYSASGGIYGQILNLYNPNKVTITSSVSYSFENLELTQEYDNVYSARITSDEVLDLTLDDNATYGVYVNSMPCNYVEITNDYVIAKYEYIFYGEDFSELKRDTLTFKFAFYSNSTYLIVSTEGGADAVKYWNYYFNKNVFDVTIDNKGYEYTTNINFGTGDVSNYSVVTYYLDDKVYLKQIYKTGTIINLPNSEKYVWEFDSGNIVSQDFVVTEDIFVYTHPFTLTFIDNGSIVTSKSLYAGEKYGELPILTKDGYTFVGWFDYDSGWFDYGNMVSSDTLMEKKDFTLYARWAESRGLIFEFDEMTSTYVVAGLSDNNATEISIPSTYNDRINGLHDVSGIASRAFDNVDSIVSVYIPNLRYIGSYAFSYCSNLTTITFGKVYEQLSMSIMDYAFYGCESLTSINIPTHIASIGSDAFGYCTNLTTVIFETGSQLATIEDDLFYYCENLTTITIPKSITSIGYGAFQYCTKLTNLTFESESLLISIDGYAFNMCRALKELILPSSISYISGSAFNGITGLFLTILATIPPVLDCPIDNNACFVIYIPHGTLEVYETAQWWSHLSKGTFVEIET